MKCYFFHLFFSQKNDLDHNNWSLQNKRDTLKIPLLLFKVTYSKYSLDWPYFLASTMALDARKYQIILMGYVFHFSNYLVWFEEVYFSSRHSYINSVTFDNTSFMSRTDGASWSHFLRASLTDTILASVTDTIWASVTDTILASLIDTILASLADTILACWLTPS